MHLVVVCDGAKGSHAPDAEAGSRARRARRASSSSPADLLGRGDRDQSSTGPTARSTNDDELRATLVGLIREHRPEVVVGPDPTATFFGGVYVNHRDHRETGWALLDAVAPAAAMPLYFPEQGRAAPGRPAPASGTHEPDVVADVSRTIDTKVKAVLAHASQLAGDADAIRDVVLRPASRPVDPSACSSARPFAVLNSPSERPLGRRSADPARRPRRLLRLGGDPRRPDAEGQARRGRRRRASAASSRAPATRRAATACAARCPASSRRRRCPTLIILPGRFDRYEAYSRRFHDIVRDLTPDFEPLGLDEVFADLRSLRRLDVRPDRGRGGAAASDQRRARVCSAGSDSGATSSSRSWPPRSPSPRSSTDASSTARASSGSAPRSRRQWLAELPVRALWGVGPATAAKLAEARPLAGCATWPGRRGDARPATSGRRWPRRSPPTPRARTSARSSVDRVAQVRRPRPDLRHVPAWARRGRRGGQGPRGGRRAGAARTEPASRARSPSSCASTTSRASVAIPDARLRDRRRVRRSLADRRGARRSRSTSRNSVASWDPRVVVPRARRQPRAAQLRPDAAVDDPREQAEAVSRERQVANEALRDAVDEVRESSGAPRSGRPPNSASTASRSPPSAAATPSVPASPDEDARRLTVTRVPMGV